MNILKLAAFSDNGQGGNPAGVAFYGAMPGDEEMLNVAKEVGYSETAFLVRQGDRGWRVRYFAPAREVELCGPVALVTAHRFAFDSRDEGASQRLQILSETNGTARCHTAYNCTNACPRDIQITKAIGELKMAMVTGKLD